MGRNIISTGQMQKFLQGRDIKNILVLYTLPLSDVDRTISFIEKTLPDAKMASLIRTGEIREGKRSIRDTMPCDTVRDLAFEIKLSVIKDIRKMNFDLVVIPVDSLSQKEFKRAEAIALLSRAEVKLKLLNTDESGVDINFFETIFGWLKYCNTRYILPLFCRLSRYVAILISGFFILIFLVPFMFTFLSMAIKFKKRFRIKGISG